MSKKWYGNLTNRLEEGRQYGELHEGMDVTMYLWSDRYCYYITEVVSPKVIKVRKYNVVADRTCSGGMGHQDWVYFKTAKETSDYLAKYGIEDYDRTDYPEETWEFRYGKWRRRFEFSGTPTIADGYFSEKEREKLAQGKTVYRYSELSGNVSFGVRSYYYDWEF